jgi:two-component system, NarL family, invasion response regulator UvrY
MDRHFYILMADNHAGFRREMRRIMEEIPDIKVTGEAGNGRELFELLRQSPTQLVILDISLSDLGAGEGTQLIKTRYPETKVLITVLDQESEYLHHGLAIGAAGVLQKQHAGVQIAPAIRTVRQGKIYLPPQVPGNNSFSVAAPTAAKPGLAGGDNY